MPKAKPTHHTPPSSSRVTAPSEVDRQRRIAEAAYYRALARGFQGGDPVDDWLAAEREINRQRPNPES